MECSAPWYVPCDAPVAECAAVSEPGVSMRAISIGSVNVMKSDGVAVGPLDGGHPHTSLFMCPPPLFARSGGKSSIDADDLPRDEAGRVVRQKRHDTRHVLGLAEAHDRRRGAQLLELAAVEAVEHVGDDNAGETVLTVMPALPTSFASAFVKPIRPALTEPPHCGLPAPR